LKKLKKNEPIFEKEGQAAALHPQVQHAPLSQLIIYLNVFCDLYNFISYYTVILHLNLNLNNEILQMQKDENRREREGNGKIIKRPDILEFCKLSESPLKLKFHYAEHI